MSGGNRRVVFNTRERVLSVDQTRHQAFAAADRAEVLRRMMAIDPSTFQELGSYVDTDAADAASIATPLKADVYDGLVIRPQAGTLNLLISPGCVGLDDPDGQTGSSDPTAPSTDDSRYKVVVDPGIQLVGALTIAAGSGSTRVDIVECQRQSVTLETESRDVFDPSTGAFVPVNLPKVSAGRLTYRVRAGTPGGGMPSLAQGWLPLCVAVVSSSATNNDLIVFWDVRPLVSARVLPPGGNGLAENSPVGRLLANSVTDAGNTWLYGFASMRVGKYLAGGLIIGSDLLKLDANSAALQVAGFTPVTGDFWNLVAVFPAGLQRWVKYLDNPSTRHPFGPNGVLAVTGIGPTSAGAYGSITPPTSSGLPAGSGVHLAAGYDFSAIKPGGFVMQNGLVLVEPNSVFSLSPSSSPSASTDRYDLVLNDNIPANARALVVQFLCTLNGVASDPFDCLMTAALIDPGGGTSDQLYAKPIGKEFGNFSGAGTATMQTPQVELPLTYAGASDGLGSDDVSIIVSFSGTGIVSRSAKSMVILGWRL